MLHLCWGQRKKTMRRTPVLLMLLAAAALGGCAGHGPRHPHPHGLVFMPGVRPLPPHPAPMGVHVFKEPKSYVSSYVEASRPEGPAQEWNQPVGYVSSYVRAFNPNDRADLKALQEQSLTDIWGAPDADPKPAVVMRDPELRHRLNAALESNQDGMAWRYGSARYTFEPNGPIYVAPVTGERCRDGVLARATPMDTERLRGLFCQKSPGTDWMLIR
jgi:hypothetical protein